MFDQKNYREACSQNLNLSTQKIEELIEMTENQPRKIRHPFRTALIAATMTATLCITAAAANSEAIQDFWNNFVVSVSWTQTNDDGTVSMSLEMPEISVTEENGRVFLIKDDQKTDITDALQKNGSYCDKIEKDGTTWEIYVNEDKTWHIEMHSADGEVFTFQMPDAENPDRSFVTYSSSENMESDGFKTYEITEDDEGKTVIYQQNPDK